MNSICMAAVLAALMAGTAAAETIGVSMQNFDNNFQTLLREGLQTRASTLNGVNHAQTDVSKQRSQVDNFIAAGVDAIIMTLADTSASPGISEAAAKAGIPVGYLDLEPENVAKLRWRRLIWM
jgi:inositol transport system substrate-binding protein